jgi:hypothetical protein
VDEAAFGVSAAFGGTALSPAPPVPLAAAALLSSLGASLLGAAPAHAAKSMHKHDRP